MKAKDYRQIAWEALQGKWKIPVIITLVYMVIIGVLGMLSTTGIGAIAVLLVEGPLMLSWAIISLKIIRKEEVEVTNLFDGFHNFVESFLLYLVNNIFIYLWSLLLVVPGVIKGLSYSMSTYILAENPEMKQSEARRKSMEMMDGHKWELFCLNLSFIGWILLSVLTCGILLLWVQPYMNAATAAFYEKLKANAEPVIEAKDYMKDQLGEL